jgi:predicted DNA-binding transcriptional regulator AlpA
VEALPPELEQERLISSEELRRIVPVSEMQIWRYLRDPRVEFPQPIKLCPGGRNFWRLSEVRAWIEQRRDRRFTRGRPAAEHEVAADG